MQTYQKLKARMKGQAPSNWSPALRPQDHSAARAVEQFGTGLNEVVPELDGEELDPPSVNQTIYQSFEWYTPSWSTPILVPDTATASDVVDPSVRTVTTTKPISLPFDLPTHYSVVTSLLPSLAALGITSVWLPPGCKATNPQDNGYGIYDLYDLGEFDWKGSRSTRWGSKEDLVKLGEKAEEVGIGLLWDAVLNHRAAGDGNEKARAAMSHPRDRTILIAPPKDVETWTRFEYPARCGTYSTMTYNWRHFSGIDWDDITRTKAIYQFVGDDNTTKSGWATDVDDELGNYDYLMFADVDYSQPAVQADVLNWATWLPTQIPGLKGIRLDAIKHYSARFQYRLIKHLRDNPATKDFLFVGEYWRAESKFLARHIDRFAGHMHLFDVKLVYNFSDFSQEITKDLRNIFKGSLVNLKPHHAVTFVSNHDTQPTQSLPVPIASWFLPHAHALILLRTAGLPCIFHGTVFGTQGPQPTPPACGSRLMRLALIRKLYAYGPQHDHFDSESCIAWSREGHVSHSGGAGLATVLNASWRWKSLKVFVGSRHRSEIWTDLMGWSWDVVGIDEKGLGSFRVGPRSIGVWTCRDAEGREKVDGLVWPRLDGGTQIDEEGEEEVVLG